MTCKKVTFKGVFNQVYIFQAVLNIFEEEGMLTKHQVLDEIGRVKKEMAEGKDEFKVSEN